MKRAGFLTEQIADTDNLLLAFYKASTGKKMKAEVRRFSNNLSSKSDCSVRFAYTKGLRHSILTAIRNKAPTA